MANHSNSNAETTTSDRVYVSLPGQSRCPGISDDWDWTRDQVQGFPNGRAKRFGTLDEARAYWAERVPDAEPDVYFIHGGGADRQGHSSRGRVHDVTFGSDFGSFSGRVDATLALRVYLSLLEGEV